MEISRQQFPRPRPCAQRVDPEAADATRRLHCRSYDDCLDVADAVGWAGFACDRCQAFLPLDALGEKRDLRGALELLVELRLHDLRTGEESEE